MAPNVLKRCRMTNQVAWWRMLPVLALTLCAVESSLAQTPPPASPAAPAASTPAAPAGAEDDPSSYSAFDASGRGFLVGRGKLGELSISGYALARYINQMPASRPSPITSGTCAPSMGATTSAPPGHGLLQGLARHAEAALPRSPSGP